MKPTTYRLRKNYFQRLGAVLLIIAGLHACSEHSGNVPAVGDVPAERNAAWLLTYYQKIGNPILQASISGIAAAELVSHLSDPTTVIDLRSHTLFLRYRIPASVNLPFDRIYYDLIFKNNVVRYSKVVFVCEDGQLSAYAASLMRMAGYSHVYYLKGGIRSWNSLIPVEPGASAEFSVVSGDSPKAAGYNLPLIKSAFLYREEVALEKIRAQFSEGKAKFSVDPESLSPHTPLVCYGSTADYRTAHPESALLFTLDSTNSLVDMLSGLPSDKSFVVYAREPENAAYLTAGLRNLGYDARFLKGVMNQTKPNQAFTNNRFPLEGFLSAGYPGAMPVAPSKSDNSGSPEPKKVMVKPVNNPAPEGC